MSYYGVMVRYVAAFFLVALLLMLVGLTLGYLSLDTLVPEDRQLTAAGALAYWDCEYYGDCDEEIYIYEDLYYYEDPYYPYDPYDPLDDVDEEDLVLWGEPNGVFDDEPCLFDDRWHVRGAAPNDDLHAHNLRLTRRL